MTATLLANELSSLISESKRKNADLKSSAEKSLQDLKAIPVTSEQQLASDLSHRPSFIDPFVLACATRNAKFAGSGIVCLQRLVISKGLAKSRLQDALEAFNSCTDLGLDVQLKILQALPSLLQNYASDLEGDQLSSALQVCSTLQAVKASTVSGVASATLQQLVSTVFEKVVIEDQRSGKTPVITEVEGDAGAVPLRPAAYDAYRLLRDLALAAEERPTKFVTFTALSPESSLELIWSCIDSNAELFTSHDELVAIIGANVFPIVLRALSERLTFAVTVRSIRILNILLDGFLTRLPGECEVALGLCTQALDQEASPEWKRALVMEVLRDFFDDTSHIVDAYSAFDARPDGKPIVQDLLSTFVRLSAEKPAVIGLGQQSTVPTAQSSHKEPGTDAAHAIEAAGAVVGVISSALGVAESSSAGISAQWSLPKTACMEQLDKNEATAVPETYIYALVLECLNGLSDCLARIVLPLTVHQEKHRLRQPPVASTSPQKSHEDQKSSGAGRTASFRLRQVPLNPLEVENAPFLPRVRAVAGLVDSCWPAVLAAASTFLNASLDDQYFRNLIKAYQRFAQVAGLLRLITPRDALMTSLAKASVPPHVLNAATADPVRSPNLESSRVFSNPMSLLSVDSLVSQASSVSDRERKLSAEPTKPTLMVRNLLCLRALLNLAIALGATLGSALEIVVSALRQTDLILSTTTPQQMTRQAMPKGADTPASVQAFSNEVTAVEAAASRLLESTAEYPNEAFRNVLQTFCRLLHRNGNESPIMSPSSPSTPSSKSRKSSGLPGLSSFLESQAQDYHFVVPKLGNLAELNVPRFTNEQAEDSGWTFLVDELTTVATSNVSPRDARKGATNVLVRLAEAMIADVSKNPPEGRAHVQRRALAVLLRLVEEIYSEDGELTATDIDIQHRVLDALRSILERSGDSLVAGWNRIIAIIISGAFEHEESRRAVSEDEEVSIDWSHFSYDLVSPNIGRAAFAATQLVCSDFLEALPDNEMPSLIELLRRFMCQTEDLNTALTTITMAWNVAGFLFTGSTVAGLAAFIEEAREFDDLEEEMQPMLAVKKPAQWLFLLTSLREVIARPQREVRNAAFQTICNVFKNYGQNLTPTAWVLLLRCTLLQVTRTHALMYYDDDSESAGTKAAKNVVDIEMSKVIITGISEVIAEHLDTIQVIAKLPSLWEMFLSMLERYLDVENHNLNAAVYFALSRVLSGVDPALAMWKGPVYRTVHLWLKRVPSHDDADVKQSNQEAYLAYAEAGEEIYRLTRETMSMSQIRTMIDNLYQCVEDSDGPRHKGDINNMSPLQQTTMRLLRSIRSDQPGIPACLVTVATKLACLHHDSLDKPSHTGPTFVAIASEAITWLQEVVGANLTGLEAPDFESLLEAIQGLGRLIARKYGFQLEHKSQPLWRRASSAAVALARPILDRADKADIDHNAKAALWSSYSDVMSGIVNAKDLHVVTSHEKVLADEKVDIDCFRELQQIMIPRLGRAELSDEIRLTFVRALFEASIVHQSDPAELSDHPQPLLVAINRIRPGRAKTVAPTAREEMAYACLDEMVNLAQRGNESEDWRRLAEAAAPWLCLRLAMPIREYIADQPLRGRRPQPLSELEELLYCFDAISQWQRASRVSIGGDAQTKDRSPVDFSHSKHVQSLYPLLVQAVATAGDRWSGSSEVLVPLQRVLSHVVDGP